MRKIEDEKKDLINFKPENIKNLFHRPTLNEIIILLLLILLLAVILRYRADMAECARVINQCVFGNFSVTSSPLTSCMVQPPKFPGMP